MCDNIDSKAVILQVMENCILFQWTWGYCWDKEADTKLYWPTMVFCLFLCHIGLSGYASVYSSAIGCPWLHFFFPNYLSLFLSQSCSFLVTAHRKGDIFIPCCVVFGDISSRAVLFSSIHMSIFYTLSSVWDFSVVMLHALWGVTLKSPANSFIEHFPFFLLADLTSFPIWQYVTTFMQWYRLPVFPSKLRATLQTTSCLLLQGLCKQLATALASS